MNVEIQEVSNGWIVRPLSNFNERQYFTDLSKLKVFESLEGLLEYLKSIQQVIK